MNIQINWHGLDDEISDLCAKCGPKWLDVVHRYDNTWTAYIDGKTLREGLSSRDEAKRFIEETIMVIR